MDDPVVVSDERLVVRKRPVSNRTDGPSGVELVATGRVDADVSFQLIEPLPESIPLETVRFFPEYLGDQWQREPEEHRLVFRGTVRPGEDLVTRWAVAGADDRVIDGLLRPPAMVSSVGTIAVGARIGEITDAIRHLESRFRGPESDTGEDETSRPTSRPAPPSDTTNAGDEETVTDALLAELEAGRVDDEQLTALRDHLHIEPDDRPDVPAPQCERSFESPSVVDSVLTRIHRVAVTIGLVDRPPCEPVHSVDAASEDGLGRSIRIASLRSQLRRLEDRVDQVDASLDERNATLERQAARIDALEQTVDRLRTAVQDRRRQVVDALRQPGDRN